MYIAVLKLSKLGISEQKNVSIKRRKLKMGKTLYIIEKNYSFQHSDLHKIVLICKDKDYAEKKYKECLQEQDRINISEDYDYTVRYELNAYPDFYVNEAYL